MKTKPWAFEPKAPAPTHDETVEVFDCEQGTEEWLRLRMGMATASNFNAIMAESEDRKMRTRLLHQVAGELLSGEPAETYSNFQMERGRAMEAEAREHYAFTRGVELDRVGFVRRNLAGGRAVGCSPDSLVGKDRVLEVKTMAPHLMVELAQRGTFPTEHRAQVYGTLWVTGREVVDLMVFYRGMPIAPTWTLERAGNEAYIREIAERVEVFDYDVRKLVEKIRNMGGRR